MLFGTVTVYAIAKCAGPFNRSHILRPHKKECAMSTVAAKQTRKAGKALNESANGPLSAMELDKLDAYWRASNYLSVGQIYLLDNPLLRQPLKREHIKPRLLGHWGTSPGLNMLCVHLNRVI